MEYMQISPFLHPSLPLSNPFVTRNEGNPQVNPGRSFLALMFMDEFSSCTRNRINEDKREAVMKSGL
jgi:hypothetical protein